MTSIPSPDPTDLILHTADAPWWEITATIGPVVVLFVAVIGWLVVQQRTRRGTGALAHESSGGEQSEWWFRARWALDETLAENPSRQVIGFAALELLNASPLTGKEETLIIAEAWKRPLLDSRAVSLAEEKPRDESDWKERMTAQEERVIVRAARLRLSTDMKQGIQSPSWVREVARRPL